MAGKILDGSTIHFSTTTYFSALDGKTFNVVNAVLG